MKEELEQSLVALATEIIAKQGKLNLIELNRQAHKLAEKITILSYFIIQVNLFVSFRNTK